MKFKSITAPILAALLSLPQQCISAEIITSIPAPPKKEIIVKIEGKIQYDDDKLLKAELDKISDSGYKIKLNAIQFNTRGGNGSAAKNMGRLIREWKLNTYVGPNDVCGSACIYAYAGGLIRMGYGRFTVHRTTYQENYPLGNLSQDLINADEETAKHIHAMGLSFLLTEAIISTPNWAFRKLNEEEMRRWGVHATDRLTEELWLRTTAMKNKMSLDEFVNIYITNKSKCESRARLFELTVQDCVDKIAKNAKSRHIN